MAVSNKNKNVVKKVSNREQIKLLEFLVEELVNEDSRRIVEILFNKKDVNEFLIAKKMDLTINQIRNILYKLSNFGLVSFIRKKDKRKGWYIYFWTLNTEKCLIKLQSSLKNIIEKLNHFLNEKETKRFYVCKPCGIEVSEETALENGFSCEECADVYELAVNDKPIRDFKFKIARRERELKVVEYELVIIREKLDRAKKRREKKELIEKEKIKEERKLERRRKKALKDAEKAKMEGKKPVKKKVAKKKVAKKKSVKKKVAKKIKRKK